jgi:choline-sulfatase
MRRREFLGGGLALSLPAQKRKVNLLYLLADDHAAYVMGCEGNRLASTPNLDRLASGGTRFAQNYCNSPVCTPSRQSFFTGQMPSAAGVTVLRTALDEQKPNLAKQLKAAGYVTAVFGKMHFNRAPQPGLHGFDVHMTEVAVRKQWGADIRPAPIPPEIRTKPVWRPFQDPAHIWLNADKLPYARRYEDMLGTYIARQACRFLEEHRSEPFALWVSFHEPHSPFDFPIEDRDRFEPSQFSVPPVGPEDTWQIPLIFRHLTPEQKQGIIAAYYTSVAFLDRNIGMVLDKLRSLGLERDTLVVYMADHGYSLGQHGRFEKHCSYDPALRVPLIFHWPGRVARRVVRDLTESIDVTPTILDLLSVDPLPVMHGRSLRAYLEGRRPAEKRLHIFSQYLENEEACIRTARWKFVFCSGRRRRTDGYETEHPTPGRYVRLFDLHEDPEEFYDVSSRHPAVVQQMEQLLLERFLQTHPERDGVDGRMDRREAIEFFLRPRDA